MRNLQSTDNDENLFKIMILAYYYDRKFRRNFLIYFPIKNCLVEIAVFGEGFTDKVVNLQNNKRMRHMLDNRDMLLNELDELIFQNTTTYVSAITKTKTNKNKKTKQFEKKIEDCPNCHEFVFNPNNLDWHMWFKDILSSANHNENNSGFMELLVGMHHFNVTKGKEIIKLDASDDISKIVIEDLHFHNTTPNCTPKCALNLGQVDQSGESFSPEFISNVPFLMEKRCEMMNHTSNIIEESIERDAMYYATSNIER